MTTPEQVRANRARLVELTRRFDIKQKCSGKYMVWNHDGTPCDFYGYFYQELGYERDHNQSSRSPDGQAAYFYSLRGGLPELLGVPNLGYVTSEIDSPNSTNASIRRAILKLFAANPV